MTERDKDDLRIDIQGVVDANTDGWGAADIASEIVELIVKQGWERTKTPEPVLEEFEEDQGQRTYREEERLIQRLRESYGALSKTDEYGNLIPRTAAQEAALDGRIKSRIKTYTALTIRRKSLRVYDIEISGRQDTELEGSATFSAWLPLIAIRDLTEWWKVPIASYSDHEALALEGDWSAIRDSSENVIWLIFNQFCR